ncbi:MAG: hypothetical protein ACKOIA_08925 [Acidimicrobiia bacterium]
MTPFDRLLKPKTKSQYQSASITRRDAVLAVKHASRLVDGAAQVVA